MITIICLSQSIHSLLISNVIHFEHPLGMFSSNWFILVLFSLLYYWFFNTHVCNTSLPVIASAFSLVLSNCIYQSIHMILFSLSLSLSLWTNLLVNPFHRLLWVSLICFLSHILSENAQIIFFWCNKYYLSHSINNILYNKVISHINMFCSDTLLCIIANENRPTIITVHNHRLLLLQL